MGAASGVGSVTFARFYALHTLVLPALAFTLVTIHVLLVLRHGVAAEPGDDRPTRKFFPDQAFKDTVAIFAAFVVLFVVAAAAQAPLGPVADPTDSAANPRPEWYFLFLFQTLKFLKGTAEAIGSVLLPTLVVAALFAVPFVDRARMRKIRERTVAIGVLFLAVTAWSALTIGAVLTEPRTAGGSGQQRNAAPPWSRLPAGHLGAFGLFQAHRCGDCHNLFEGAPKGGPTLGGLISAKTPEQLASHYENPGASGKAPASAKLDNIQFAALTSFISSVRPDEETALLAAPPAMTAGARIVVENRCTRCHTINGVGGSSGPSLNGVATRRSRAWIEQHLKEPESQTPDTIMPSFEFSPSDRDLLINYLFALPEK
jgi:ubiquinol-cytochrome c reductase cytochrome b subunit